MIELTNYLKACEQRCAEYMNEYSLNDIRPSELKKGATEYFSRGGKRLRPAFLALSAGAVGGKEKELAVTPAMVSVELFHTFTLVHDDIIDNDDTRRGGKSVHKLIEGITGSAEYGKDIAILAGDTLHALSVKLLLECAKSPLFSPETVLSVAGILEGSCINELLAGEAVDTRQGVLKSDVFDVGTSELTLEVMRQKTGVLFSYCAKAGAMLGKNTPDENDEDVKRLGEFASLLGVAFQLKDDILGIISDEKTLGKPIGSDIREGKKTLILQKAYENANKSEKEIIKRTVGNESAKLSDVEEVKKIFITRGGVEYANSLADEYVNLAKDRLCGIKESEYTKLLLLASEFMTARKL